eukprot:2749696-Rhodomonas_salina.1
MGHRDREEWNRAWADNALTLQACAHWEDVLATTVPSCSFASPIKPATTPAPASICPTNAF